MSHTLIGIQLDLTTEHIILQTDRQIPEQIASLGFVQSASHHAGFDLIELDLRNCSLQPKEKSVVEFGRIVDAIFVGNEHVKGRSQFEQLIPIQAIARQA